MTLEEFRDQRAAAKREAILEAAEAHFGRNGFAGASMEQVAKQAKVSTATMYKYFSNKEQLFEAVAEQNLTRLATGLNGAESSDTIELKLLAKNYAAFLTQPKTRRLFRMIVAECERDKRLAERFYDAYKLKLSGLFVGAIEREIVAGRLNRMSDVEAFAGQLQGMIEHGTILRGLVRGDDFGTMAEAEATAEQALTTWLARWRRQ